MKTITLITKSESSKASDEQKLRFNLTDKTDLRKDDKHVALPKVSIYCTYITKSRAKAISLKYQDEEPELREGSYSIPDIKS